MAPIYDEGFGRLMELARLSRARSESGIGEFGHSLEAAPEDLPRGNPKTVTPRVIPADVHEPDEAAIPPVRNHKCASSPAAIDAIVVLFAGYLPPSFPILRRLDEPRLHMAAALMIPMQMDCVVSRHNSEPSGNRYHVKIEVCAQYVIEGMSCLVG
jgi:hypothetical protein